MTIERDVRKPYTTQVTVPVTAQLVLEYEHPTFGKKVHEIATEEMLREMQFRHENRMYDRTREIIGELGFDPDEGIGSQLRYFIEHVTHWDGVHEMDPTDFPDLTRALALDEDPGTVAVNREELRQLLSSQLPTAIDLYPNLTKAAAEGDN